MDAPALTRRGLIATTLVAGAAGALAPAAAPAKARKNRKRRPRRPPVPPIGAGGKPTPLGDLARIAREIGRGEPVMLLDLAALDANTAVVAAFAREQGWAVRPALKTFGCVQLGAYVMQRLPEPRGLLFHLGQLDAFVRRLPPGSDLLLGYPPTLGELREYLRSAPPAGQRAHRLRILVDSVPLLEELAVLARDTRRPLPLDVALELDSGMGRGGFDNAAELAAGIAILRAQREKLRLGAVLCYDGHATLTGEQPWRQAVAATAQGRYQEYLDQLAAEASDLYNAATLIRNGPASANYRNWAGSKVANEISPGSALLYAHYLSGFDNEGLTTALHACAPVMRITSGHPSVPYTQAVPPGADREEVILKLAAAAATPTYPAGVQGDELSGGGNAFTVPKGAVALGDYVVFWPEQGEESSACFATIAAVREGTVRRVWPTLARFGARPL